MLIGSYFISLRGFYQANESPLPLFNRQGQVPPMIIVKGKIIFSSLTAPAPSMHSLLAL
jgi:hypothetical protein